MRESRNLDLKISAFQEPLVWGKDGPLRDPTILLTRSKYEADRGTF